MGFKPATLRAEGNELTTEPPHPRLEKIVSGSNAIRDYLSPKCIMLKVTGTKGSQQSRNNRNLSNLKQLKIFMQHRENVQRFT